MDKDNSKLALAVHLVIFFPCNLGIESHTTNSPTAVGKKEKKDFPVFLLT